MRSAQSRMFMNWAFFLLLTSMGLEACSLPDPPTAREDIPPDYAEAHMPKGWWADEAIIEEGRQIYLGLKKNNVNCAHCHGKSGKPVRTGARDFTNTSAMKEYSDSHLLWRISEGIKFSQMRGYKGILSLEEIWKVVAFVSTLGLKGLQYDAKAKAWVPVT